VKTGTAAMAATLLALALPQATPAQPAAAAPAAAGRMEVLLRPVRDGGTDVTAIAVRQVIRNGNLGADERLSLTAPIVYAGVVGIADRVENLVVTDREGVVPLAVTNDAAVPGGFPYFRHWRATRAVAFPLTISYRSLVEPIGPRRGPPFGIRPAAGGVSGAGSGFLVIPENGGVGSSQVRWDLSDLEAGSLAASSFGDGDFTLAGSPAQLIQGWYMAGPAGRFPATGDLDGFSATWLGTPPWNAMLSMAETARIYAYLGNQFTALGPPPRYRVFVRILETPPFGGGTALTNSFMLSRGPAQPNEGTQGPQGVLFHEMIHGFVGGIDGPQGVTSWFSEGLTSWYTTQLQLRGGFDTVDEYGAAINEIAREYYANPARNWSAARIVEVGFSDNDIRHLPYRRGELYFADLDARIRARSNGARTLDSVMQEVFARRAQGGTFDHAVWRQIVTGELGPEAAAEFDALILDGTATIVPASDAFGPCFARQPTRWTVEGRTVEGYRWERVPGVPDAQCAR
jgi:hypothetical protein